MIKNDSTAYPWYFAGIMEYEGNRLRLIHTEKGIVDVTGCGTTYISKDRFGLLLSIFLLTIASCLHAQSVQFDEYKYSYAISEETKYDINTIIVTNKTKETVVLWFEKDSIVQTKTIGDKVRNYFFATEGKYSIPFAHIIYDYGNTANISLIGLFNTFYKLIEPQETFTIQVICRIPYNKDIVELFKKMITTVTPSQLRNDNRQVFSMFSGISNDKNWEVISFKPDILVINGQDIVP